MSARPPERDLARCLASATAIAERARASMARGEAIDLGPLAKLVGEAAGELRENGAERSNEHAPWVLALMDELESLVELARGRCVELSSRLKASGEAKRAGQAYGDRAGRR